MNGALRVLFRERLSSFKVSIRFGLVLKAYISNLSKIGPVVAEIFLVLTFGVFFHRGLSSMKGHLHLKFLKFI